MIRIMVVAGIMLHAASIPGADIDMDKIRKDLTFEVIYSGSTRNIDAVFSLGSPEARIHKDKEVRFDFEPMAAVNHGLMIGNGCASVCYGTDKNLTPGKGSLELVVKNINWNWGDNKVHMFLSSLGPELTLYLYQHAGDGLGIYLEHPGTGQKIFPRVKPPGWKLDSKHHLAVTWNDEEISLYLDGKKMKSGTIAPITGFPREISLGPWNRFGAEGNTSVGYIRFYRRALSDVEIAALAVKELPALKVNGVDHSKVTVKVLPESPWFKTRPVLGMEALDAAYVPAPWKAIEFTDNRGKVWGREYDFSGGHILTGISTSGETLLREPVQLEVNGMVVEFGEPRLISRAPGRVKWARSGPAADLQCTFEYDGMVWCELKLRPEKQLEKMVMTLPMTAKSAHAVHYTGVVDTLRSVVAPQHSYSHSLPEKNGTVFQRKFCTHLWAGSTTGGLQFFAESDRHWYPKDRDNAFEIIRSGEKVDVKVNFVTGQLPAGAPEELVYQFGFIATPVKPLPGGWRANRMSSQYDIIAGHERGSLLVYWYDDWSRIMLDPEPWRGINREKVRAKLQRDTSDGRKIIPYWSRLHLPMSQNGTVNPDGPKVYDSWGQDPQRQRGGSHDMMRCAATSPWSDYLVWCVDQWAERFGPMDGVYIDEMELTPNSRAASGGGYTDFDGARRPSYSALADRDLYKRMHYVVARRNGGRPPWSVAHCSGTNMMEVLSSFTVFLTGEHLYSGYFAKDSELLPPPEDRLYYYSYALPIDRVKTEFFWRQWGAVITWLPCLKNQRDIMERPEPTRDLLSRIMQGDVLFWPLWCNKDEVYKTWKFREEFDIGNDNVTFVPYWENAMITASEPGVVIGYYRNGDKVLALVSNLNREKVKVTLNFRGLEIKSLVNAETKQNIDVREIEIPRNDYIALRMNY